MYFIILNQLIVFIDSAGSFASAGLTSQTTISTAQNLLSIEQITSKQINQSL